MYRILRNKMEILLFFYYIKIIENKNINYVYIFYRNIWNN